MIKTYASHFGRLFLFIGLCLSAAHAQRGAQPGTSSDSSSSYAVTANSSRLSVIDPPPLLRPASTLIIRNFIEAENKFRQVLTQFSFKRDVVLQTIGDHGEVTGEYIRNSVFVIDDRGERIEQVFYHPKPSIKTMKITKEDIQDLAGSQLLGLEVADLDRYKLAYAGEDNVDGQPTYIVQVTPSREPDPNNMRARFFVGLIWIDKSSYQILKLRGTTEPHGKQRFPVFQTIRNQPVENLRFPSATAADDMLHFASADVHYRINVRYYDFKRFASRLTIVEVDK
jgi:hypothetical protein